MGTIPSMKLLVLACLVATASAAYKWDSCGTKLDRLKTQKLSVAGSLEAGSKVTVTASGITDLHVPLETGAWQVRIYEDGEAHETHTEFGDLMKVLKFDDKLNTTFTMTVSFTLPAKKASGKFNANIVAIDQSKADYLCLDVKYAYSASEALTAPPAPFCLHHVDAADHKCFEYCQLDGKTFADKDVDEKGMCDSSYNTVDKTHVIEQCPDGVTNLRYCHDTAVNVTVKIKGQAGLVALSQTAATDGYVHMIETSPGDHCLEVHYPGGADSPFWKSEAWKYSAPIRPEWKQGKCDYSKWTSKDQHVDNYDGFTAAKNAPYGAVEFEKYGFDVAEVAPPAPTCLHNVDEMDHKCFEACSPEGKAFKSKGLDSAGACPASYNFVEKTKSITQCPDGVTNLRYCAATALNVTMKTKGMAGVTFTEAMVGGVTHCTKDSECPSSYCQNPGPNGACHACGDACCLTDKDCPGSYCANDPTKMPPYTCHGPTSTPTSFTAPPPPAQPFCLHHVDTADHKCFEYCQMDGKAFADKDVDSKGACDSSYNTVDKTHVIEQCPDGVTNLRYCAATAVNVTVKIKGQAGVVSLTEAAASDGYVHMIEHSPGDHCLEVRYPGGADSPFWKSEAWKYSAPIRPEWKQGKCDYSKWTSTDSKVENYDGFTAAKNSPYASVEFKKYGYGAVTESAPPAPYCLHHVDTADHKCFEYCQMDGKTFADKDVDSKGACDSSYNTVDKTHVIEQCPDGVTNLRYCAATAVNVTVKIKGQAGEVEMMAPEDNSAYCMNDKSKHAPFYCHCPPLPTNCKTDKDCVNPWYKSYCMNDASKKAPYFCKQVMPPTCKTDKDCAR